MGHNLFGAAHRDTLAEVPNRATFVLRQIPQHAAHPGRRGNHQSTTGWRRRRGRHQPVPHIQPQQAKAKMRAPGLMRRSVTGALGRCVQGAANAVHDALGLLVVPESRRCDAMARAAAQLASWVSALASQQLLPVVTASRRLSSRDHHRLLYAVELTDDVGHLILNVDGLAASSGSHPPRTAPWDGSGSAAPVTLASPQLGPVEVQIACRGLVAASIGFPWILAGRLVTHHLGPCPGQKPLGPQAGRPDLPAHATRVRLGPLRCGEMMAGSHPDGAAGSRRS